MGSFFSFNAYSLFWASSMYFSAIITCCLIAILRNFFMNSNGITASPSVISVQWAYSISTAEISLELAIQKRG